MPRERGKSFEMIKKSFGMTVHRNSINLVSLLPRIIENLEATLGQLQDGIVEMKSGFADKFQHLEDIVTKLCDAVLSGKSGDNYKQAGRLMFYLKLTKLEFLTYRGDEDPTEWFNKVDQFFEYQRSPVMQKVSLASYHLQGEVNQWWRWLRKAYQEEGKEVTWEIFYEELWSRFVPTDCEDFDEALSKTQKALVGTFMGGLKPKIADGIRMFKPTNLKDATSLARMRDGQLNRLSPIKQPSSLGPTKNTTMKRLTWDEMQKKRAQGICFNCDEKFSVGYKCKGPQLLVMESALDEGDYESFIYHRKP
ncbi:hypothetical protein Tco_0733302 [Tanacetum coccineum]